MTKTERKLSGRCRGRIVRCCHKEKNARCPGQCASKLLFEASSFVSPPDLAPCANAQVAGFHRAVPSTTLDNGYMMVKRRKAFHHIFIARCSIVGLIIAGFPRLSRKKAKKTAQITKPAAAGREISPLRGSGSPSARRPRRSPPGGAGPEAGPRCFPASSPAAGR